LVGDAMNAPIAAGESVRLRDRYSSRVQQAGESSYFANVYYDVAQTDGSSLAFGDILHYTRGHLQALIERTDDTASSLPVKQMPADQNREYVHSQMFWMVKGDHVFVVQSTSLDTETLENYLTWLLIEKANVLAHGTPVVLASKFDPDVIGGDLGDIQELVIGGVASPVPTLPDQPEERITEVLQHGEVSARQRTVRGHLMEVLEVLLGGKSEVQNVMKSVPEDAELRVDVHIGFETRKRKVNRTSLKQLETGLRNIPDSQLQVRSKGSVKSSDGTVRLHYPANVLLLKLNQAQEIIIGSLIDPSDMLRAMHEAYLNFVNNGKIVP